MKSVFSTYLKRILAGASAAVLFAASALAPAIMLTALLPGPVASAQVNWPLTWVLDRSMIVGKATQSGEYGGRFDIENRFGDGFAEYRMTEQGTNETSSRSVYWVIPSTISANNEKDSPISVFHTQNVSKAGIVHGGVDISAETYYMRDDKVVQSSGGFGYKPDEHYDNDYEGSMQFTYRAAGNNHDTSLVLWQRGWEQNGALRNEDNCREVAEEIRFKIVVTPTAQFLEDWGQDMCSIAYIYRLSLGDATYLEPSAPVTTSEPEDDGWIEEEDIAVAQSSKGSDEGTVVDEDIVEGEDESRKDEEEDKPGGVPFSQVFSDEDYLPDDYDDTDLPTAVSVGGAGAIAAGAGIAAGANPKAAKKKKEEKKKKKQGKYRMYVSKDFGDTLCPGESDKKVYARMVEVLSGRLETYKEVLTQNISVSSADGRLIVQDGGMTPQGRCAVISVPEDSTENCGTLSFRFVGEGGAFTKHIVFKITNPEIRFAQENLGLPAHHEKEEKVAFGVVGMPEDVVVTAVCEDTKKEMPVYEVALEQDPEEKRLYYLKVKDILPDDEEEAGTMERYIVKVKAQSKKDTLEEYYPIIRVHMGLALFLEGDAIGCFMRVKEGHEEMGARRAVGSELAWNISVTGCMGLDPAAAMIVPGVDAMQSASMAAADSMKSRSLTPDDIEPCVTMGKIFLLRWNEETHLIERIAVVPDKDCYVTPIELLNDKMAHREEANIDHMTLVSNLGICIFPTKDVDEHGARTVKLCSTKAALDPPTRFKALLSVTATFEDKQYSVIKEVLLHSMPFRQYKSHEEEAEYEKWDAHIRENLTNIECRVYNNYMYHLYSFDNMLNRMLQGYDKRFGYDNNQINVVMNTWTGFLEGRKLGARGRAEAVSLADDLAAAYAFIEGMRDNGGILGRIALGICTAGYSEHIFFAMEMGEKMKAAVFACTGDDDFGFYDGIKMGVTEYAVSELKGMLFTGGLKLAGGMVNLGASVIKGKDVNVFEGILKKYRNTMDSLDEGLKKKSKLYKGGSDMLDGVTNFFNSSAKAGNEAMNRNKQLEVAAEKKAQTTIAQRRQGKGTELKSDEYWAEVEINDLAREAGMDKVRNLWSAQQKMSKARGTNGGYFKAKAEYEEACKEVWKDKNALKQLKNYDGANGIDMRYEFNRYRENVKARVSEKLLDDIAQQTGKKRSDLYISSATSNSNADARAGKTVPEDWDVTVTEICYADPKKSDVFLVIDQKMAENSLSRQLYKELYGVEPPSIEAAKDMAKKLDVTYVQPVWTNGQEIIPNPEAYADLAGMIDPKEHGRELKALGLNRNTFAHKGNEWYRSGDSLKMHAAELRAKAESAFGSAKEKYLKDAMEAECEAVACYVEGTRQITKQTNKISIPRNACRMAKGAQDAFSKNAREIHALAQHVGYDLSPGEFFLILRDDYGIDKYTYTLMMSECLV